MPLTERRFSKKAEGNSEASQKLLLYTNRVAARQETTTNLKRKSEVLMSTLAKDRSAEYLGNGLSLQQESSDELKPPLAAPTPKLGGISFPRQDSTHDDDKEDQLMDISDITCTADEVAATTA